MSKGDTIRPRAVPYNEYEERYERLECPEGGMHERDEDEVCMKCNDGLSDLHPDIPPGYDLNQTVQ